MAASVMVLVKHVVMDSVMFQKMRMVSGMVQTKVQKWVASETAPMKVQLMGLPLV